MELDEQLYQNWLLQLQTWAADGRLFSAGVDALRLKPGKAVVQLKRIAKRLAATGVIDVIVQLGRDETGKRGITQIAESHTLV